ncbi:MAG: T9SS type A sorting domain-containing protein [Bacteroidales bacterium]|nr:T9SS type A sorting domain-containing protein [Bacteroidales bacterium]
MKKMLLSILLLAVVLFNSAVAQSVALPDQYGTAGTQVVIPVMVQDFANISAITLDFTYNPAILQYQSFQNPHLFGGFVVNAQNMGSVNWLSLTWNDLTNNPMGINIPDGVLINIVFNYTGNESDLNFIVNNCTALKMPAYNEVQLVTTDGSIKEEPEAIVYMLDQYALPGEVKVPLMANFFGVEYGVGSFTFFIIYDNTKLTFSGLDDVALPAGSVFVNTISNPSRLIVDWVNPDPLGGGYTADGLLLNMVFNYTGASDTELKFQLGNCVVANNQAYEIDVDYEDAWVLTCPPILADVTVVNPTCVGSKDGSITVSNASGATSYEVNIGDGWYPLNGTFSFTDLEPDTYTLNIRNASEPVCTFHLGDYQIVDPDPLDVFFTIDGQALVPFQMIEYCFNTDLIALELVDEQGGEQASGTPPFSVTFTINGGSPIVINDIQFGSSINLVGYLPQGQLPGQIEAGTYFIEVTELSDFNECTLSPGALAYYKFTIVIEEEPLVSFGFNGVEAGHNASFTYCYGVPVGVSIYAMYGGTAPYTVTYELDGVPATVYNLNPGDFLSEPQIYASGVYEIVVTDIIDANNCHASEEFLSLCTASITINEALSIICPEDIEVSNDQGLCDAWVDFAAVAGGVPTPIVSYSIDGLIITSPHLFPVGSTTVTVVAENICGTVDCSFDVVVEDISAPAVICSDNLEKPADPGQCEWQSQAGDLTLVSATDNCGIASISWEVTFPATGPSDPEIIAAWDFEDATKLLGNLPYTADEGIPANANIATVNLTGGPIFSTWVTGAGGSGTFAPNTNTWHNAGSNAWTIVINTLGYNNLTLGSKQQSSSTGPRDFVVEYSLDGLIWVNIPGSAITVANNFTSGVLSGLALPEVCNNQPTLHLRWLRSSNIAVNGSAILGGGTNRIDDIIIIGTPNSENNIIGTNDASGIAFSVGISTVSYTVTDESGNETSCSFSVTVNDTEAPVTEADGTSTIDCIASAIEPVVPNAVDNCDGSIPGVLSNILDVPNPLLCSGTRTYTYSYTDLSDNTSYWTYTFTVLAPVVVMPENAGMEISCPSQAVEPTTPVIADNCGRNLELLSLVQTSDNTEGCVGEIVWTATYEDCSGATYFWTYTYTVLAPVVVVPDNGSSDISCPSLAVAPTNPVIIDNCGRELELVSLVQTADNTEGCAGQIEWTATYEDCSGTTYFWVYTYTVLAPVVEMPDNGASVIACPSLAIAPNTPVIADNCGRNLELLSLVQTSDNTVGCSGEIVWTATYEACNGATYFWTFTYTVLTPVVVMPENGVSEIACPSLAIAPNTPVIADNCGRDLELLSLVQTSDNTEGCAGEIVWTATYEDCAGATYFWTYSYTLLPATGPELVDENVDCSSLNQNGLPFTLAEAEMFDPASLIGQVEALYTDNCGGAVTAIVSSVTAGSPTGPNSDQSWFFTYEFTITDVCGNFTACNVTYSGSAVPETVIIDKGHIRTGEIVCYGATQTITISGLSVYGSLTLIAGESIHLLPGFKVFNQGYLHAYIGDNYCVNPVPVIIAKDLEIIPDQLPASVINNESFFKVFPNPTSGSFILQLEDVENESALKVEIYNMLGERLFMNEMSGYQQYEFNVSDLTPGIYIVRCLHGDKFGTERLIKK